MSPSPTSSPHPPGTVASAEGVSAATASPVAQAPSGERVVPYHCPFCAEEDLRPHPSASNAWYCRACLRIFSVKFLGMEPNPASVVPSTEFGGIS